MMPSSEAERTASERLLRPHHVALFGASERGNFTRRFVTANEQFGRFSDGSIHLVNRHGSDVFGHSTSTSLDSFDEQVDVAVIALPHHAVEEVVGDALAAGIKSFVVHSAGFDNGPTSRQSPLGRIAKLCRMHGAELIGPNCMGLLNMTDGWSLYGGHVPSVLRRGNVSVLSQSGSVGIGLINAGDGYGLDVLVSTGNETVTTLEDCLEWLVERDSTEVIACYVEQLRLPEKFRSVAARALQLGKPIVVLKSGRSERGAVMSASHTGALAGESRVYSAVFDDLGVVEVDNFDEFNSVLTLFSNGRVRPRGPRAAIFGISGGELGHVADLAESVDLPLANLSSESMATISAAIGVASTDPQNPIDLSSGDPSMAMDYDERISTVIDVLDADDETDVIVLSLNMSSTFEPVQVDTYRRLLECSTLRLGKAERATVLLSPPSFGIHPDLAQYGSAQGVPVLQGVRDSLIAISKFAMYERKRSLIGGSQRIEELSSKRQASDIPRALQVAITEGGALGEHDVKRLLSCYGIRSPHEVVVNTRTAAEAKATELGFPVVLKIHDPAISHKSDIGGVILDLQDADQTGDAFDLIVDRARSFLPEIAEPHVLVASQHRDGIELIVGAKHDPQFGPMVLIGTGGTLVELVNDVVIGVAPQTTESARRLIERTVLHPLLAGYRGSEPADIGSLAEVVVVLGQLIRDYQGAILDVEINPLLVGRKGGGCVALDARLSLRPCASE